MIGSAGEKGRGVDEETAGRDEQIRAVASQFIRFIELQTDSAPPDPDSVDPDSLISAAGELDAALNQLVDMGDAYGTDRMSAAEPLVLPAAAVLGEYLRAGASARWEEPEVDADTTLIVATPDGIAIDLTGAVRASLLTGEANLRMMIERLVQPDSP